MIWPIFIIKYQQYHRELTNNAQFERLQGNTILRATEVILATPSATIEITVSYGCAYWITKAATHWKSLGDFERESILLNETIDPDPFLKLKEQYIKLDERNKFDFISLNQEVILDNAMKLYLLNIPTKTQNSQYYTIANPKIDLVDIIDRYTTNKKIKVVTSLAKKAQRSSSVEFFIFAFAAMHEFTTALNLTKSTLIRRLFTHSSFLIFSKEPSEEECHSFPKKKLDLSRNYTSKILEQNHHLQLDTELDNCILSTPKIIRLCHYFFIHLQSIDFTRLKQKNSPLDQLLNIADSFYDIEHYRSNILILLVIQQAFKLQKLLLKELEPRQYLTNIFLKISSGFFFLEQYDKATYYLEQLNNPFLSDRPWPKLIQKKYDHISFNMTSVSNLH